MADEAALIHAFGIDGAGGGDALDWSAAKTAWADGAPVWLHLNREAEDSRAWLEGESGLPLVAAEALLAAETRPRSVAYPEGRLLILRGVNLNPGADADDMVSLRLWCDGSRVISVRIRKLMAVQDVKQALELGDGPKDAPSLLLEIAERLFERMGGVIGEIDDEIDAMEAELLEDEGRFGIDIRRRLNRTRHMAITLRRFVAPQRDALGQTLANAPEWLSPSERGQLREIADRVTRYVEDLDAERERAGVVQDELANRQAEMVNRRMYVLSMVTAIFLPLGFLTGLLGINVAGMPGAETHWAFLVVVLMLLCVALGQILYFRSKRWF